MFSIDENKVTEKEDSSHAFGRIKLYLVTLSKCCLSCGCLPSHRSTSLQDCVMYLWTTHGCYGVFKCAQKPSIKVWKRLSTCHAPTNKQRIRAIKRDLFKSVMRSWTRARFWNIFLLWQCFENCLHFKTITSSWTWKGVDSVSYFWSESVTKAMTSQLCFHSFMWGGGRGGMMRKQQLLNSTGLVQGKVYTNYLLGLCRGPLIGKLCCCVCATTFQERICKHRLQCSKSLLQKWPYKRTKSFLIIRF